MKLPGNFKKYATEADLFAAPVNGAIAVTEDVGKLWIRQNGRWVNIPTTNYTTEENLTISVDYNDPSAIDPPEGAVFSSQLAWDSYLSVHNANNYKHLERVTNALPEVIIHDVVINLAAGEHKLFDDSGGIGTKVLKTYRESGNIAIQGPEAASWPAIDTSLVSLTVDSHNPGSTNPWLDFSVSHSGIFSGLDNEIRGSWVVTDNGYVGTIMGVDGDRLHLIEEITPAPIVGTTVSVVRPVATLVEKTADESTPNTTFLLGGNVNYGLENNTFGSLKFNNVEFKRTNTGYSTMIVVPDSFAWLSFYRCHFNYRADTTNGHLLEMDGPASVNFSNCSMIAKPDNGADSIIKGMGNVFLSNSYAEGFQDGIVHQLSKAIRLFGSVFRNVGSIGGTITTKASISAMYNGGIDSFGGNFGGRENEFYDGRLPGMYFATNGGKDWGGGAQPPHGATFYNCQESCIVIGDNVSLDWSVASGSTGFKDGGGNQKYGIEFIGSNSHIILSSLDNVSGTLGDVKMVDGSVLTYSYISTYGPIIDSLGNIVEVK